ncbi:hypothetical protein [Yersinia enterocolitica]|nr:hypothetical protein [Yersinia enterocolitica]
MTWVSDGSQRTCSLQYDGESRGDAQHPTAFYAPTPLFYPPRFPVG